MSISLKSRKILWTRSGNKCAICKHALIVDSDNPGDDPSIVADEAHIVARSKAFTRGNYAALTAKERDHYSNLILLCKTDHKQVDDQPEQYTVERLREIKAEHELDVQAQLTDNEQRVQEDELVYAGDIDQWAKQSDLANWGDISSWLSADSPMLPKDWFANQRTLLVWMLGRIWPGRHPQLEDALLNYQHVLADFITVFARYVSEDPHFPEFARTRKFYQIREWDEERYAALGREYDEHVGLVTDLFAELTRAANFVCDRVRETIFSGYRIKEGAVLLVRSMVGMRMETVHLRVEYRGEERTNQPYPGLEQFKEVRYETRDYALERADGE